MMVKFFPHGQGPAAPAVAYLVAETVKAYDEHRNAIRDERGQQVWDRRATLPEVVEGTPARMQALIDAVPHQWRYKSGVISFAAEDAPTEEQQRAVIQRFEDFACAGLEADQFDMLWVRHTHAGRVELHFLMPRMELSTRKSLNIAPPGHETAFSAFVDLENRLHGWADPLDPARARQTQAVPEEPPRAATREQLNSWIEGQIAVGAIRDRGSMISALTEIGFKLPRKGKAYLTVLAPDSGERWRLKGAIFDETWTAEQTQPAHPGEHGQPADLSARLTGIAVEELKRRVDDERQKRLLYNQERYGRVREPDPQAAAQPEPRDDRDPARDRGEDRSAPSAQPAAQQAADPAHARAGGAGRRSNGCADAQRVIPGGDVDDRQQSAHADPAPGATTRGAARQQDDPGRWRPWRTDRPAAWPRADTLSAGDRGWTHLSSSRGVEDDLDELGARVAVLRRRARQRRGRLHDQIGRTRRYAREVAKGLARIVERHGKIIAGRASPRDDGGPAREARPWVPQTQQVASPQRREVVASSPPTERRTGPSRSP
ncbi:relaxase/mobilization nuclease domain-containing protein [Yangia mangrovi]|uniref:Mobilization relaxase n=1 Tax=Alloyangia mangrovi TaxID=1779329 RepID=A0A2A3JY47_9RHOB|nr:relaxase/mobilization nuclease domain-containing protein [Alloyangia mangrovi]